MGLVWSLFVLGVVLGVLAFAAVPLRKRATPLSLVTVTDDEVVVDVHSPVWLTFRRQLRAPRSSVTGARVLPAGVRPHLSLRVAGTGLPGIYLGWFWKRGVGFVFVVYRPARDAVEIDIAGDGRVKRWLVESAAPDEVVAALSGVPSSAHR